MNTTKQRHEARDQLISEIRKLTHWSYWPSRNDGNETKALDLAIRHIIGLHELMDAVDNVLGVIGCEGEIDSRHEFTQQLLDLMYELDPK